MENQDTKYARWLNGELTPEEQAAMDASGELQELEAIKKAMTNLRLPKYDHDAAFQQLKEKRKAPPKKNPARIRRLTWISAAASILILVGLFYWLQLPKVQHFQANNGETLEISLPNGSIVTLNDGSSLQYNKNQWQQQRQVDLQGEAYFDVTKGPEFSIQTRQGTVTVLGTQFNVRSREEIFQVDCYSGRVQVARDNQNAILTAAQTASWQNSTLVTDSLTLDRPAWQSGLAQFSNASLKSVFAEFERQYDVSIIGESVDLSSSFTGAFRLNNLEQGLRDFCTPKGLNYQINGKTILISPKNQ